MQMQRLVPMPIGKPAETELSPAAEHPNILFVGNSMLEKIAKGAVTGFFLLMTLVMSIIAVVNYENQGNQLDRSVIAMVCYVVAAILIGGVAGLNWRPQKIPLILGTINSFLLTGTVLNLTAPFGTAATDIYLVHLSTTTSVFAMCLYGQINANAAYK